MIHHAQHWGNTPIRFCGLDVMCTMHGRCHSVRQIFLAIFCRMLLQDDL